VDVQGNLAQMMYQKDSLFSHLQSLIKGIQILEIPIIWVEQNPQGLGPTIPQVATLLGDSPKIAKQHFSCYREVEFVKTLQTAAKTQVLLAGIETHVCIYQTATDLVANGFEVQVVVDAVSSRTVENKAIALQKMRSVGIGMTSVEMALFELLEKAGGTKFKQLLQIVK
jgi:nicotinamidase-related amidase